MIPKLIHHYKPRGYGLHKDHSHDSHYLLTDLSFVHEGQENNTKKEKIFFAIPFLNCIHSDPVEEPVTFHFIEQFSQKAMRTCWYVRQKCY